MTTLDQEIIHRLLNLNQTYDQIASELGVSRGKVWKTALRNGARKNEARIAKRARDRKIARTAFLKEVLDSAQQADVLDFLDGLPDESVNLVVTSPPYNIGVAYGGTNSGDRQRFHYYLGWMLMVLSECSRVLDQGGTLFLQIGSTRDDANTLYPLDALFFEHLRSMGLTFQSRVVWEIPFGLTPKRRLAERYETVLVFSKGPPATFNATPARTPQKQPGKRAFKGRRKGQLSGHPYGAHPTNVWRIRNVGANHRERCPEHPAQFPEQLARLAILLYSMPGNLVCDPFCGTGTTQVAAVQTGRHFVGCDLHYHDCRRERLAKIAPELVSALPGISDEASAIWQAEARRVDARAQPVTAADNRAMLHEAWKNLELPL